MTSEDRDLVEELLGSAHPSNVTITDRAAARIQTLSSEIDREAVRAEQAAELAKFKALAETLAGALELADCALSGANMNMRVVYRKVAEALRQYKEARDAS